MDIKSTDFKNKFDISLWCFSNIFISVSVSINCHIQQQERVILGPSFSCVLLQFYTQIASNPPEVLISCTSKHPNKMEQGQLLVDFDRPRWPGTRVKDSMLTLLFAVSSTFRMKNRLQLILCTTWLEVSTLLSICFYFTRKEIIKKIYKTKQNEKKTLRLCFTVTNRFNGDRFELIELTRVMFLDTFFRQPFSVETPGVVLTWATITRYNHAYKCFFDVRYRFNLVSGWLKKFINQTNQK